MRRAERLALLFATTLAFGVATHADARAQEEAEDAVPAVPPGHGGANPHGGGTSPPMFQPPPDTSDEDPRVPAGGIAITILDPDNNPLPNTPVTLGIVHNTVAKGESREHKLGTTDATGGVSFAGLERGSGIAYRVSVTKDGGSFWASPFMLPPDKGMRVVLHVYPVTRDIEKALIVSQMILYTEMKDDRVQVEQALTIFNFGRTAWVPEEVFIGLPDGFTALNSQQAMGGEGIDPVEKRGAKIRGTFGPGQHVIEFRWQMPYAGEESVTLDEKLPRNVAIVRVMSAASQQMRLAVSGFPEAVPQTDQRGERILITQKEVRREDPQLDHVHVELRDLPTPGPGRKIATALAGLVVLGGLGYAFSSRKTKGPVTKELRARLLEELEELERARRAGDIGPKTYERARRELIDAIARSLALGEEKEARAKATSKGTSASLSAE